MPLLKRLRAPLLMLLVAGLVTLVAWPKATLVDTAAARLGDVRETVEAEGRTRLVQRFDIAAPSTALARRLELEPGDPIQVGQVLVRLDPLLAPALDARERAIGEARLAAAEARREATEAEARAARAALELASSELNRGLALRVAELTTAEYAERLAAEREQAEAAWGAARAAIAAAEREVDAARAVLTVDPPTANGVAAIELRSPIDGVVVRRHYESERVVQAGELLLEVGTTAALEVEVDVLSTDAVRLSKGTTAELHRWGQPEPLRARVRLVEPGGFTKVSALGVEEQRVWVRLDLLEPPERIGRLGDGYRVHARFELRSSRGVVVVPQSAVFRHGDGHAVFVLDAGRARRTAIERGIVGQGYVEVRAGLEDRAMVIVHPDREIEHGARVRARRRTH